MLRTVLKATPLGNPTHHPAGHPKSICRCSLCAGGSFASSAWKLLFNFGLSFWTTNVCHISSAKFTTWQWESVYFNAISTLLKRNETHAISVCSCSFSAFIVLTDKLNKKNFPQKHKTSSGKNMNISKHFWWNQNNFKMMNVFFKNFKAPVNISKEGLSLVPLKNICQK